MPVVRTRGLQIKVVDKVKYLGVVLDGNCGRSQHGYKNRFQSHAEAVAASAKTVFQSLRHLAARDWGLKMTALRLIYKGVIEPMLTYAAGAWAVDGELHSGSRRTLLSAQRYCLLQVVRAYRTVSGEALPVLAGVLPVDVLISERAALYAARKSIALIRHQGAVLTLSPDGVGYRDGANVLLGLGQVRNRLRRLSTSAWQSAWDAAEKGVTTYLFLPEVRLEARVPSDRRLMQFLTGHGGFREYLSRFGLGPDGCCPRCGVADSAQHVIQSCLDNAQSRETFLDQVGWPAMPSLEEFSRLVAPTILVAFTNFCHESIDLRAEV